MRQTVHTIIPNLIETHHQRLVDNWLATQKRDGLVGGQITEDQLAEQSRRFLAELRQGVAGGQFDDISGPEWDSTRSLLDTIATERAVQGFSPSETAVFVFSLKEPLFELLRQEIQDVDTLARENWVASLLIDKLGMHTVEVYQKGREEVIRRQQEELIELSTPVIQLWDAILALPLIGTLDSARTQTVMESLLERIVSSGAEVAIIDITGVPTVDTLVAQHLIKTVSAARLMGADCIISGIRPQIAQTIVHLGLELDVVSKATMADAFALALRRVGKGVVERAKPQPPQDGE
ncbi:MAG TPA: STAS domain-containing protein [Stellaceae bacterium]|nr:STAS domain-containing protein [Stellaceae bacterium]